MVHLDLESIRIPPLVRIWDKLLLMLIPRTLHMMYLEIHHHVFAGKENTVSLTLLASAYVLLWDQNLGCWSTGPMSGLSVSVAWTSGSVRRTEYKIETLEEAQVEAILTDNANALSKGMHYTQITAFPSIFSKRWTFHFCRTEEGWAGWRRKWEMAEQSAKKRMV